VVVAVDVKVVVAVDVKVVDVVGDEVGLVEGVLVRVLVRVLEGDVEVVGVVLAVVVPVVVGEDTSHPWKLSVKNASVAKFRVEAVVVHSPSINNRLSHAQTTVGAALPALPAASISLNSASTVLKSSAVASHASADTVSTRSAEPKSGTSHRMVAAATAAPARCTG